MNVNLFEFPGIVLIAIRTNHKAFCLKCGQICAMKDSKFKVKSKKVIIEKAKCAACNTTNRTFRKYKAYFKSHLSSVGSNSIPSGSITTHYLKPKKVSHHYNSLDISGGV